MKAKRRVQSYNLDDEIIERIRKDALSRSMTNGNNVSRSDIVNEILSAHYAIQAPAKEDPSTSKSSAPHSEQISEPTNKYSFNLDEF